MEASLWEDGKLYELTYEGCWWYHGAVQDDGSEWAKIKEETKATIRCIPLEVKAENGLCIYSGNPSKHRVLFAKAY